MTTRRDHEGSLRPGRLEISSVVLALVISAMIHGGGYGIYKAGQYLHVWENLHLPSWLAKSRILTSPAEKKPRTPDPELELSFVSVNPQAAVAEPPPNAKFYSDQNSQAANPEATPETGRPKIDGRQTDYAKAEDVPRAPLDKLQPAYPPVQPDHPAEQAKPKTTAAPGDLAMAKPDMHPRPDNGTAEQSRPRTIREALSRQNRNQVPGAKMKQDGGVNRSHIEGFDTKATPFGVYDAVFIDTVTQRWYDLLDQISYDGFRSGEVELKFRLHYDGRITDMEVIQQNVGDMLSLLCQKAVLDPAPFEKWPADMRRMADKDYRELHFIFFYRL